MKVADSGRKVGSTRPVQEDARLIQTISKANWKTSHRKKHPIVARHEVVADDP
jgi:hypothetical protein